MHCVGLLQGIVWLSCQLFAINSNMVKKQKFKKKTLPRWKLEKQGYVAVSI